MEAIRLDFEGPYSFLGERDSIFDCRHSKSAGVYLWTVRQQEDRSHLIHHIRETEALARRHRDRFVEVLGLNYGVFDLSDAKKGISTLLWQGLWRDKSSKGPREAADIHVRKQEDIVRHIKGITIFFAPLGGGATLRKHVEGCIGQHIRSKNRDLKALYPDDNMVGPVRGSEVMEFRTSATEVIKGLDASFACMVLPNKAL